MNPFRPRTPERPTEDDLIAFHLHELSPSREHAVRRAIGSSPALAAESDAIADSLRALKDVPMQIDDKVLDRNWNALRPSLARYAPTPLRAAPRWRLPLFAGALVASAATLTFVATKMNTVHSPRPDSVSQSTSAASRQQRDLPVDNGQSIPPSQALLQPNPKSSIFPSWPQPAHSAVAQGAVGPTASDPPLPAPLTSQSRPTEAPVPPASNAEISSIAHPSQARPAASEEGKDQGSGGKLPLALHGFGNRHNVDLMFAMGGNFIAPHTSEVAGTGETKETASHAVAAIAAFHQQFRPALGYRVTVSYSRPDFLYSAANTEELNSRIYEVAGTYVVQGPHRGRIKTSADVGAGLLAFLPTVASQAPGHVYRASGVVGVNADFAITRHWGARASYRAQVYKSPDFSSTLNFIPSTNSVIFSNEPSLGITYIFGRK